MTDLPKSPPARLPLLLVLSALTGCHARPVAAPGPPPLPPVAHTLDGLYRGTSTRYRADRRTCPPPGLVHFEVIDGVFTYSLGRRGSVQVTIAPDRTLHGTDGDFEITGSADDSRVRGHADSQACGYEFGAVRKK